MKLPTNILKNCWFLAGPTACGKSSTSLQLAERLRGEIVSLDSMAIFRGMDIGTAKPSREDRERIPHHLIDIVGPHEEFSVAAYVAAASTACEEILERGRVPLFVGGTGLYLRGVLRGVFEGPAADWELRRELETAAREHGPEILHRRLRQVDPQTAARLHQNDVRRVIRALEVHQLTGKPLSAQQQQGPLASEQRPSNVFWLSPPRDWLYDRINRRVEFMIEQGLVNEVQELLDQQPPLGHTAGQALGYREIIEHLSGKLTLENAIETIQTRTRQFAKRQHTWFRNLEECRDVVMTGEESGGELAERILQTAEASA